MAKWFLARPYATPFGPMADDELRSRIRQGTVAPDALVWARGMREWLAVRNVSELAAELKDAKAAPRGPSIQMKPEPSIAEEKSTMRSEAPRATGAPAPTPPVGSPAPVAPVAAPVASPAAAAKPPYPGRVDPAPDSGGTVILPDAPKRPASPSPHEALGPSTARMPPTAPTAASTAASRAADTEVRGKLPPASALAPPPGEAKRTGPPRVLLIGGALVVVLLLVIVGASAKSRSGPLEQSALYAPCLKESVARLTPSAGDVPCGEAKLSVQKEGTSLVIGLSGVAGNGMAAKTPELLAGILPNLPAPNMSRSLEIRQVMKLDLRGVSDTAQRTRVALKTYVDAEKYLEAYKLMGGHRFARWLIEDGRLEVENKLLPEGPRFTIQFFPGEGAPGALTDADRGLNTPEVPWAAPWNPPSDPAYLVELRKAMMAQGWWYDDAEAFMNAAAVDGIERTSSAAAALRLIAEWLRTSDQWDAKTRHSIWTDCFSPRINGSASGVARERFDQLAGAKDIEPFANPPDYHNADEQITVEGFTFNAAIGSATHAYCAIAMGDPLIDVPQENATNKILRRGPPGARSVAERLIKSPKFLAAIGEELVKARAQLLKPGAPEL
jgi:GYF domain 2